MGQLLLLEMSSTILSRNNPGRNRGKTYPSCNMGVSQEMAMFPGLLDLRKSEGIWAVCISLCGVVPTVWREVVTRKGKKARAAFPRKE